MGDAIMLVGLFYMPLAIILTVYFIKLVRRASSLAKILEREAQCRIRVNYELPPPTEPITGMTKEQLIVKVSELERVRDAQGWK